MERIRNAVITFAFDTIKYICVLIENFILNSQVYDAYTHTFNMTKSIYNLTWLATLKTVLTFNFRNSKPL